MHSKKILIAFEDKESLASNSEYLRQNGFNVLTADDGAAVLEIALNEKPYVIVIEMALPVIEGEKVFHILRNNPNTADIPFVFIGSEAVDIKGFRTNLDTLTIQPVKPDDIMRRINNTLAGAGKPKTHVGDKEIEGRLSHISLGDLLQILHLNKKEGILKVFKDNAEGFIYIKQGTIYNATIGGVEKEKALFRLLTWHDGKFEFLPRHVNDAQKINRSTGNLLMEGMRQYDEWNKAQEQLPKPDSRLKLKVDLSTLPKGLKPIIYEVLFLIEFYPVVGSLVDHCAFPDYEVYQTLAGLIRKGILEEIKSKTELIRQSGTVREIISPAQALKVREKVAARWADMETASFGKIFIVATNDNLIMNLVDSSKELPGFSVNRQFITSQMHRENPLGDIAKLKLYGGMEIIFFAIPRSDRMKSLWKAFSKNLIGIMLLCDKEGIGEAAQLAFVKDYILSIRRVPVLHIFTDTGETGKNEEDELRRSLKIKRDERMFAIGSMDSDRGFQIFNAFFNYILKDDYITV